MMVFISKVNNYMFRPKAAIFRLSQLNFAQRVSYICLYMSTRNGDDTPQNAGKNQPTRRSILDDTDLQHCCKNIKCRIVWQLATLFSIPLFNVITFIHFYPTCFGPRAVNTVARWFQRKILDTLGNNCLAKEKNAHYVGSSLTTTRNTLYAPHSTVRAFINFNF